MLAIIRTVSGYPSSDRRAERRQDTLAEIVAAAWELVREHGLAGLSMRDLGRRVGMRAQSIYSYFGSKHEIYDAMFLEGYQAFAAWMEAAVDEQQLADDPVGGARLTARKFVEFCTVDPVRYQLLFQRTIPGFEPSPESYAVALQTYEQARNRLGIIGIRDPASLDLWTAMLTGLTDQQISNDPGGDRWERLVDRAADMLLAETRAAHGQRKREGMTTTATIDATAITPIDHRTAMQLQATELGRAIELLRSLDPGQWAAQTNCPDWDVRRMWLHVLGACEAGASIRENVHQMIAGRKHRKEFGVSIEAGLSAVQVAEREDLTPGELIERLAPVAPKTVKGRTRTPRLMRAAKMSVDAPVVERWSLGYLIDIIYLRDMWMHRIDTALATGAELVLTSDHDGVIVADVVAEWARRHGQPFTLELTGAAGGVFTAGSDGERTELDAIEFCSLLAGRGDATGLLTTIVPF